MENKPAEAVRELETAIALEPGNDKAYLFLGIAYEQLQNYQKAVETYNKGLRNVNRQKDTFLFNMGNNYFRMGSYKDAIDAYSRAVTENRYNVDAYLNRANAKLSMNQWDSAIEDYKLYLSLEPESSQKSEIERLIALLTRHVLDERERIAAEEQRRAEEEARQKELLEQVLSSLQQSSSGTTHLQAGSETISGYDDEFDIVD